MLQPVTTYTLKMHARRFNHRLHSDCNGRLECSMCHWAVRPNLSYLYDMPPWVTTPCVVVQAVNIAYDASQRLWFLSVDGDYQFNWRRRSVAP